MTSDELTERLQVLNHQVGLILAMLDRELAQMATVQVTIEEWAEAAWTDGVRITLPYVFQGVAVFEHDALAVGLLTHECGHFFHPLEAIFALIAKSCPHWLANLVLDIHGETMIECLSPRLAASLTVPRALCEKLGQRALREYDPAGPFSEQALQALLAARFATQVLPFDRANVQSRVNARVARLLEDVDRVRELPASELPGFLRGLLRKYPELKEVDTASDFDLPSFAGQGALGSGGTQGNKKGVAGMPSKNAALRDILKQVVRKSGVSGSLLRALKPLQSLKPSKPTWPKARIVTWTPVAPDEKVSLLARRIETRFASPNGSIQVTGLSEYNLHEALRGLFPFTDHVDHPQGKRPRNKIVIGVDTSGSMSNVIGGHTKREQARLASQALCLALQAIDSDVRALVFDDDWYHVAQDDPSVLFATDWPSNGGTCFQWLTGIWQTYPAHRVIVLTDGWGDMPMYVQPCDRQRTSGLVIPDGDVNALKSVCGEVVRLDDLELLSDVISLLVPMTG